MKTLFNDTNTDDKILIGKGLHIIIHDNLVEIYRNYTFVETKSIARDFERRLAVVQLVTNYKAQKGKLATAFSISRQSIDNWLDSYQKHELLGLINNSKDSWKKNPHRFKGNKARDLEQERLIEKELLDQQKIKEEAEQSPNLNFEVSTVVPVSTALYKEEYPFEDNRFAGSMLLIAMLEHLYQFHDLAGGIYQGELEFLYLLITMHTMNIGSVEQLKVVQKHEFGRIIGMSKLPSLPTVWSSVHKGVDSCKSSELKKKTFDYGALNGVVGLDELFLDGHLIPYYGKENTHKAHFTQRDMMIKGQSQMTLHDTNGGVVYYQIEEGQGNIVKMLKKCSQYVASINCGQKPLIAVDREVWGVKNFIYLKEDRIVSWEKNTNSKKIQQIDLKKFGAEIEIKGRNLRLYEDNKTYSDIEKNTVNLRRVIFYNTKTEQRLVVVTTDRQENKAVIVGSMLNRWGSNENTFKHMGDRTHMHYNPVIDISEDSSNQNVANSEYKEVHKELSKQKTELRKKERDLGKVPITINKSGVLRKNSSRETMQDNIKELKQKIETINAQLKDIPKRIELEANDPKRFKKFNNEGLDIWALCETVFWNSRKELIKQFATFLPDFRDTIPVLEALIKAPGRIRSTPNSLIIKLETLQVPRYKSAQIQLMRAINKNKIKINGKIIQFDKMSN